MNLKSRVDTIEKRIESVDVQKDETSNVDVTEELCKKLEAIAKGEPIPKVVEVLTVEEQAENERLTREITRKIKILSGNFELLKN